MSFKEYSKGYKDALEGVENKLNESLERYKGLATGDLALKTLNDVINFLHIELVQVADVDSHSEEVYSLEKELQDELITVMMSTIRGGKQHG
jgi:hypothetical protein